MPLTLPTADSAADVASARRGRQRRGIKVTLAAAFAAILVTAGIIGAQPASASTGTYGVVAVHNGSFGYREVVLVRLCSGLIAPGGTWVAWWRRRSVSTGCRSLLTFTSSTTKRSRR
jgi:hypothetical protein